MFFFSKKRKYLKVYKDPWLEPGWALVNFTKGHGILKQANVHLLHILCPPSVTQQLGKPNSMDRVHNKYKQITLTRFHSDGVGGGS
jgi:hypothetical protein